MINVGTYETFRKLNISQMKYYYEYKIRGISNYLVVRFTSHVWKENFPLSSRSFPAKISICLINEAENNFSVFPILKIKKFLRRSLVLKALRYKF